MREREKLHSLNGNAVGRNKRSALRRSNFGGVTRLSRRKGAMRYAYCAHGGSLDRSEVEEKRDGTRLETELRMLR